jgi:hypothetical protein
MNATQVLQLDEYVKRNKNEIRLERLSLVVRAKQAAKALGFRVSSNAIKSVLAANDIEIARKKSKATIQIETLAEENKALRGALSKIAAHTEFPDWLRDELTTSEYEPIRRAGTTRGVMAAAGS